MFKERHGKLIIIEHLPLENGVENDTSNCKTGRKH